MKTLSLTQPWATLCAVSTPENPAKDIETRGWPTRYTGPLCIHAAKNFPKWAQALCETEPFRSALRGARAVDLPRGVVLCERSLYGCRRTEDLVVANWLTPTELAFGDYTAGRHGLLLGPVVRIFNPPIQARGSLGIWEWTELIGLAPAQHEACTIPRADY